MTKRQTYFSVGLIVSVFAIAFAVSFSAMDLNAQTTPPLDDTEFILDIERSGAGVLEITKIGRSTVDGSIWTVISDGTNELDNRAATSIEQTAYLRLEQLEIIERWVNNRTTELNQCETDATDALALGNWTTLSNGVQNAIIASLLTCQEINSKVNRKTINALLSDLTDLDPNGN